MAREAKHIKAYQKIVEKEIHAIQEYGKSELVPIIHNIENQCRFSYEGHLKEVKKKRILRLLLDRLKKLSKLGISIEELMEDNPFPTQAFQREDSRKFIDYARKGDKYKMRALIKICKYYVYEYDHVGEFLLA